MYDILPSSGSQGYSNYPRRRPKVSRRRTKPSANVVQIDWKLPARLRKPVKQQLAQERAAARRRKAVIDFERRPLNTKPLVTAVERIDQVAPSLGKVQMPQRRLFNRRPVPKTENFYAPAAKPRLQLAPPPYVGTFTERPNEGKRIFSGTRKTASKKRAEVFPVGAGERDVPVVLGSPEDAQTISNDDLFVKTEKPVAAGVTFSLWPGNWFGGKKNHEARAVVKTGKKKLKSRSL